MRKDINSLKSIAIISVVLFHFFEVLLAKYNNDVQCYLDNLESNYLINLVSSFFLFRGGYLGVDIFLVISGFLICHSVLKSQHNSNHNFSFIDFYKRRFYRLGVPFIPLIVVCLLVGKLVLSPQIFHELVGESARSLLFISNYFFANQGGYFSLNFLDKILLHTWYLSLVGQFYIIFPIFVCSTIKLIGIKNLKISIFALTIILFVYAEFKYKLSNADNLYYLSSMRAWELLFGASLTFIRIDLKFNKICYYLGFIALILVIILTKDQNYNPARILLITFSCAVVIIANYQSSFINNNKLMQFIGRSSYSLYLWHWPILVFSSRLMIIDAVLFVVFLIVLFWIFSYYVEMISFKNTFCLSVSYLIVGIAVFATLVLNKIGLIDLERIKEKSTLNYWVNYQSEASIKEVIVDPSKGINTLMIGDSNLQHYLDYFSRTINFRYIELAGTVSYGKSVYNLPTNKYSNEYQSFYSNFITALNTLHKKNSCNVVIANKWQLYNIHNPHLFILDKYKNNVLAGILSDLDKIIRSYPECNFFLLGNPVMPNYAELAPIIDEYYLNSNFTIIKKIRDFLGVNRGGYFKPSNISVVNKINSNIESFANSYANVYFIDRNTPICLESDKCFLIKDKKPIFTDIAHLSIYGGEVVGSYILKKMRSVEKDNL